MQDNPCGGFTFDVFNYLYIIEIDVGLFLLISFSLSEKRICSHILTAVQFIWFRKRIYGLVHCKYAALNLFYTAEFLIS